MKHSFTDSVHEHGNVTLEVRAARKPGGDRSGRGTREAPRMLALGMHEVGMMGTFKMQTTTQMKQRNQNRHMHFVRMEHNMKFARITLKPGDNGTCWEWVVRPPQFYDLNKFEREMRRVEAHLNGDKTADELLEALGSKPVKATEVSGVSADSLEFDIDDALERADGMLEVEDHLKRAVGTAKLAAEVAKQALLNKGIEEKRRREAELAAEQAAAKKSEQAKPAASPPQPLKVDAPTPAPVPAPSENGAKPNLIQRLTKAHELAQPYIERRDSISAKQREIELKYEEIATLEQDISVLKQLQERDTAGAEAAQLVDALSKFV